MISAEEVIEKLKDEGDFDRLRHKIIRKLKENEELRNSIISEVKQSAAINRAGAENLKPRQLSDAIHEEIGKKVMGQISDALWQAIRSSDGMQSEIKETVESVYNRLLNPRGKDVDEPHPNDNPKTGENEALNDHPAPAPYEREDLPSSSEPKVPPGFSGRNCSQLNTGQEEHKEETPSVMHHDQECGDEMKDEPSIQEDVSSPSDPSVPPGFGTSVNDPQLCASSDDDPDVPPGFG